MSEMDFPLPPPTFEFLVFSLKTQAEMQLRLFNFGGAQDDIPEKPNLTAARHAIDLLTMIAEKTRGNLSMEEQRLIENSLTELRFRFVQVSDRVKADEQAEKKIEDKAATEDARKIADGEGASSATETVQTEEGRKGESAAS